MHTSSIVQAPGSRWRALRAAPSWEADQVDVLFWLIREDDPSDFEGISWASYLDQWLALVVRSGRFSVHGQVATLEDLTAKDYVESDPLDLDHLSRRDG